MKLFHLQINRPKNKRMSLKHFKVACILNPSEKEKEQISSMILTDNFLKRTLPCRIDGGFPNIANKKKAAL